MTHNDINRMFTEEVGKLLAQGYQIHTNTMGGSQGQLASVDLYRGTDVIRVLLTREMD